MKKAEVLVLNMMGGTLRVFEQGGYPRAGRLEVETLAGLTLFLLSLQGHRPFSQPTVETDPTGGCLYSGSGGSQEEGPECGGPESHSVAPFPLLSSSDSPRLR